MSDARKAAAEKWLQAKCDEKMRLYRSQILSQLGPNPTLAAQLDVLTATVIALGTIVDLMAEKELETK